MRPIVVAAVLSLLAVSAGWGGRVGVADSATRTSGGRGSVWSISCAAPGDCAAGGSYRLGPFHEAFLVDQKSGRWGTAIEVPGTAKLNSGGDARVTSISCTAAGDCAAGGYYRNGTSFFDPYEAFVVSETNGRWRTAIGVPGIARLNRYDSAAVNSISCAATGECAAGGFYQDDLGDYQAFVVSETNGVWGTAIKVPGTAKLNTDGSAEVSSISCPAPGECAAGGSYTELGDYHGNAEAFVVSETNGSWGKAIEVPGFEALNTGGDVGYLSSISCAAVGECAAGGIYADDSGDQAFVVSETNGSWGTAIEAPGTATLNTGGFAYLTSISCAAAGECAADGLYSDGNNRESRLQAFVVSETNGSWGTATDVPGTRTLNTGGYAAAESISCPAAGECAAGGYYSDGSRLQAFVVSETNGSWGTAIEVPGTAALNTGDDAEVSSISCAAAGECAAGGFVTNSSRRHRAFVVGEANGSWGNAIQVRHRVACLVPNVVGKAMRLAKKRLNAAGCGAGKVTYVYSTVPNGHVVAQRPKPGKALRAGARVALTVSKG